MRGYRVFTFDRRHFPSPARAMARLNQRERKVVPIIDPGVEFATACIDGTAQQWDCSVPSASPPWLDELVRVLSGLRFDDNGELQHLFMAERLASRAALQQRLDAARVPANSWEQLARWSLARSPQRPYTPGSRRSGLEVAASERDSGRPESVEAVLRMAPGLPLTHLTLAGFESYADRADFLRRYELARLPPADVPLRLRAATMLRAQGQPRLALQASEEIRTDAPPTADLLVGLATSRWLAGN